MKQQLITMTQKELSRLDIIQNLIDGHINGTEASTQTGLTVRQIKNIKAKVIKEGASGIIHKNRNRESNRRILEAKISEIEKIVKEKYSDFGPHSLRRNSKRTRS